MGGGGEPWKGDVIVVVVIVGDGGSGGGKGGTGHWGSWEGQERLGGSHQTYSRRKTLSRFGTGSSVA